MSTKTKFIGNYSSNLKIGIIGTTNVGKSSLFNLLSKCVNNAAITELSLFTTVDPNVCIFSVIDPRFNTMVSLYRPQKTSEAKITLIDTSGVVSGSFSEVLQCSP